MITYAPHDLNGLNCHQCGHPLVDHGSQGCCACACGLQHASTPSVRPASQSVKTAAVNHSRADLLPPRGVIAVARVFGFFASSNPPGWQKFDELALYTAAALCHVFAYLGGERNNPESGEHHLAHAVACLLFVVDLDEGEKR